MKREPLSPASSATERPRTRAARPRGRAAPVLLGLLLALGSCRQEARPVRLAAEVDDKARAALAAALEDFNASRRDYVASLLPPGSQEGDLRLGNFASGSIPWRGFGYRLWARLETLAALEAETGRVIIRPLRSASLDPPSFVALLEALAHAGYLPLVSVREPRELAEAQEAFARGLPLGSGDLGLERLQAVLPDLGRAADALSSGKAVFLLGDENLKAPLTRPPYSHPESFALPGSSPDRVFGRGQGFSFPDPAKPAPGALKLLTYLTSRGPAREFAKNLPGDFYYWEKAPGPGELPEVKGPKEFVGQ